ncbi:trypsin-like peptidase domain-containing protein [Trinickia terrae]|uniref:Serine protease n=1 Tax=Trinickia terrae TaxID=2571161 RepID=A0A4U1HIM2_9BURK|nr:serine protease [Trinickia terrae]TKC79883.1 trypsin-like peptidase domain-containing protein [Trinickia terrae]
MKFEITACILLLLALDVSPCYAECIYGANQWGSVTLKPSKGSLSSDEVQYIESIENSVRKNFEPSLGRLPESRLRRYGEPIGRLEVLATDKSGLTCVNVCTGFLVASGKLLTNRHCVQSNEIKSISSIKFRLGYLGSNLPGKLYNVNVNPSEVDEKLDYAILDVQDHPEEKFGLVNIEPVNIEPGEDLIVIGHPLGQPQQFSVAQCTVAPEQDNPDYDLKHLCQTTAGNSGSPIFDEHTGSVIALHHGGPGNIGVISQADDKVSQRSAIPISTIVAYSSVLQRVSNAPARVEISDLKNYYMKFYVRRNKRLICAYSGRIADDLSMACPVAITSINGVRRYEVSGTAKSPTGSVINISGKVNVDDGDDSGSCSLLLTRSNAKIEISQVCG